MELGSNRARNFRRRAADDDEDNQNDDSNATTTTTTARPTKAKPKKLLSFADDEDAAETPSSCSTTASRSKRTSNSSSRPTKPSSSSGHKITTHRDRQSYSSTTSSTLSNVQPQAGTYTKEALLELQKNTRTLGPSRPASSEPVIVLNDDEDDEEKIWEEEQFRKGLGKRMDDGTSVVPVVQSVQQQQQKFVYPAMPSVSGGPSIGGAIGVSQGLDAMISIPQQAEIAKKALQDNVRRLKESHGRTISSLTKTDENLTASYANITALGKSLSVANEKFIFMQKLRQFVSVICDFLQV
ncbi:transcriptional repressor ILP1 [Fagus crenata]